MHVDRGILEINERLVQREISKHANFDQKALAPRRPGPNLKPAGPRLFQTTRPTQNGQQIERLGLYSQ